MRCRSCSDTFNKKRKNALKKFILTIACVLAIAAVSYNASNIHGDTDSAAGIEEFIRQHAEAIAGEEWGQRKQSKPFDFDHLRGEDVAVLYWIAKDNDSTAYLAVFETTGDSVSLTNQVRLGGRGLRHITDVSYSNRSIIIQCLEFAGHEPLSSPSLCVTITATMKKGLLDIKREEHED